MLNIFLAVFPLLYLSLEASNHQMSYIFLNQGRVLLAQYLIEYIPKRRILSKTCSCHFLLVS